MDFENNLFTQISKSQEIDLLREIKYNLNSVPLNERLISCQYEEDGCLVSLLEKDLIFHEEICEFATVLCNQCNSSFLLREINIHSTECIECDLPDKEQTMVKDDINNGTDKSALEERNIQENIHSKYKIKELQNNIFNFNNDNKQIKQMLFNLQYKIENQLNDRIIDDKIHAIINNCFESKFNGFKTIISDLKNDLAKINLLYSNKFDYYQDKNEKLDVNFNLIIFRRKTLIYWRKLNLLIKNLL